MAAPIGNNFIEGVLGVVQLTFDNVDLGKTLDNTEIVYEETIKDIFYAQSGTSPSDKIPTGVGYSVTCQFAELDNELIEKVLRGTTKSSDGSMKFGRNIYTSLRDAAKELKLTRVDSEGDKSTDPYMIMTFLKASPMITGNITYGPDAQRILSVTFYCFFDETESAYGYYGYPSSLGITP